MKNIFLSYATENFVRTMDELCKSAIKVGFDDAHGCTAQDLDPGFVNSNLEILSQPRGAGYWLWKPQIILKELKNLKYGDLLVYSDAGRSDYYKFEKFPVKLSALARRYGYLLGPTIGQHGPLACWTKRDAFVLLNMDRSEIHRLPPIQATWSFWTPTTAAFEFLTAWLDACRDPRILTDIENTQALPNLNGYIDHRHDQSVLSLLAYKFSAPYINLSNSRIENILKLRRKSRLANYFLKRIDDVESILDDDFYSVSKSVIKSFFDARAVK